MTAVHGPSQLVCFVEICIVTHTSDRNKGSRAQYLHCRCHVWRPCWMWLCRRIFVLMDSTCFPNMRATTTFHVMMLKGLNDIHPPCHFESLFSLNPSLWIPMCFLILMLTCSIPKQFWPSRLIFAPCIFVNNAVIFFNRFFPHYSFQNVREWLGRILWENNMGDRDMYTICEQWFATTCGKRSATFKFSGFNITRVATSTMWRPTQMFGPGKPVSMNEYRFRMRPSNGTFLSSLDLFIFGTFSPLFKKTGNPSQFFVVEVLALFGAIRGCHSAFTWCPGGAI